jgi:hypothetical protein
MTREDIIRMAREAGWTQYSVKHPVEAQRLDRFAALVAAAEREACAKVCEDIEMRNTRQGPADCAVAIRARGSK